MDILTKFSFAKRPDSILDEVYESRPQWKENSPDILEKQGCRYQLYLLDCHNYRVFYRTAFEWLHL